MATEADLLAILARSIGISNYQGLSLQTRYNTTVCTCESKLPTGTDTPQLLYSASKEPTKHIICSNNRAKENKTRCCILHREYLNKLIYRPDDSHPRRQQLISIAKSHQDLRKSYLNLAISEYSRPFCYSQ
ncbi:hypothetical protein H5410_023360 [Solanum commersonii]|uniref:Uncharacterized protein n=1 Tax=Solanum commersonii TaxID=4109 RepID=A0A9J5ZIX1_SOLCO|nr:hypothetical protein H5410_023360 [Solanum commersonii]